MVVVVPSISVNEVTVPVAIDESVVMLILSLSNSVVAVELASVATTESF